MLTIAIGLGYAEQLMIHFFMQKNQQFGWLVGKARPKT